LSEEVFLVTDPPYGSFDTLEWDKTEEPLEILKSLQHRCKGMIIYCNGKLFVDLARTLTRINFVDFTVLDKRPKQRWVSYGQPLKQVDLITFWGETSEYDFRKFDINGEPIKGKPYDRLFQIPGKESIKNTKDFSYKQFGQIWSFLKRKDPRKSGHKTQKHIDSVTRAIQRIKNKNAIIMDPFEGSGTTRLASKILSRKYIGRDKYFQPKESQTRDKELF
jgi:hypothetical protein